MTLYKRRVPLKDLSDKQHQQNGGNTGQLYFSYILFKIPFKAKPIFSDKDSYFYIKKPGQELIFLYLVERNVNRLLEPDFLDFW